MQTFESLSIKNCKCLVMSHAVDYSQIIIELLKSKQVLTKLLTLNSEDHPPLDWLASQMTHAINDWQLPDHVLFLLGDIACFHEAKAPFHQIIHVIQSLSNCIFEGQITLSIITDGIFNVLGTESLSSSKSLLIGPLKVIEKEIDNISCHLIDVEIPENEEYQRDIFSLILNDIFTHPNSFQAAYRGKYRWEQKYDPIVIPEKYKHPSLLKEGGTYLITGGIGGIGSKIADYLGEKWKAKLLLTTRRSNPQIHQDKIAAGKVHETIRSLKAKNINFQLLQADVTDLNRMDTIFKSCYEKNCQINGIIHAAGVPGGGLIHLRNQQEFDAVLRPKVDGMIALENLVEKYPVDFLVSFSSLSTILGEIGQADYCSANNFLNAATFQIQEKLGIRTIAIDWARWEGIGMAEHIKPNPNFIKPGYPTDWIASYEGLNLFEKLLTTNLRQVIVCPYDLDSLIQIEASDPLRWVAH